MSTDKKEFYRKELNLDKTALGAAINALLSLENRWPEKKEKIQETVTFLNEIRNALTKEGHEAYKPKIIDEVQEFREVAVDEAIKQTALDLETIKLEAEELAKELEAKRLGKEAKDASLAADELIKAQKEAKAEKIAKIKAELEELEVESD